MLTANSPSNRAFIVIIGGVILGLLAGVLVGAQPLFLGLGLGAIAALVYFFADFERSVLALLIFRCSLDNFGSLDGALRQIPAIYAITFDFFTLICVVVLLLTNRTLKTDKFWWFFAGWIMFQGLWLVLMPLGGLGLDASFIGDSLKEWTRMFSWLMVYLLVMQLRGRMHPEKVVNGLFLALIIPLTIASMQVVAPSVLPPVLSNKEPTSLAKKKMFKEGPKAPKGEVTRVKATLGHSNGFATYLLLFIGLTWWKITQSKKRWPWFLLLGILAFFFVGTKALFSLMMLAVFIFVLVSFQANFVNLLGGAFFMALVIALFLSTEFGQQRLSSLSGTPLFNPEIDYSRAILLSKSDYNSFNWRISQWTYLLNAWTRFPYLGYGIGTSMRISANKLLPHNDYVRALIEGGILGLTSYLFFFGAQIVRFTQLLRWVPKKSSQRSLCMVLFAILLAIPVGMITENIWSHTTFFFYWWALFAVAGWNWDTKKEDSPPELRLPAYTRLNPMREV